MQPLVLINTVGLSSRRLPLVPRLHALAQAGWHRPMQEVIPAVTCTAQASMLTGKLPQEHGIVGNGWLYRDTMEVRFWQQSNRLLQAEPLYVTARRRAQERGQTFRCAKLFWWFNQGAAVDISVTPKPHYGADGNKAFDILSEPDEWTVRLKRTLGNFPFQTFWGPMAGLPCTQWIARAAAEVLRAAEGPPQLTLVYLPHLDYDTQRFGPDGCDWGKLGRELDAACEPLLDTAHQVGARVWVVNEYAHVQVVDACPLNRLLRGIDDCPSFVIVRDGPFGEQLDTLASKAFAVCDHQVAHVYYRDPAAADLVSRFVESPWVGRVLIGDQRREIGLDHPRSGDAICLAKPHVWFSYYFWHDDRRAPDYARTVDIHRKPGYDPCELFFSPKLRWPKLRVLRRLVAKRLGFRTLFDVIPLETSLVHGSHGLPVPDSTDKPVLIGDGPAPAEAIVHQCAVRDLVLRALDLGDG
jgi:predicted AlkP superfamily pyrophosphatase or phosphodiesterase